MRKIKKATFLIVLFGGAGTVIGYLSPIAPILGKPLLMMMSTAMMLAILLIILRLLDYRT
jgi:hypothetical protein